MEVLILHVEEAEKHVHSIKTLVSSTVRRMPPGRSPVIFLLACENECLQKDLNFVDSPSNLPGVLWEGSVFTCGFRWHY